MMARQVLGLGALAMGLMVSPAWSDDAVKDRPGPIDSLQDLQDTGKMMFKLADTNNDGQISQQEALDVGNLIVGGQFFRADKDGNGTVTKEEAQQARETILAQRPYLRALMQRARAADTNKPEEKEQGAAGTPNVAQGLMSLLDSNNDGQLQAPELRQMVQTTVQSVYAVADTNRDGQMSPSEVNAALAGAVKSVVQAAYQRADNDGNGQLSQAEYEKAVIEPANLVFRILDVNTDGQLSQQEFQAAERVLASQIRKLSVPEPANAPSRLIESGRRPAEVAPVPNFAAPGTRPAQPTAPAQPATPAPAPAPAPVPR